MDRQVISTRNAYESKHLHLRSKYSELLHILAVVLALLTCSICLTISVIGSYANHDHEVRQEQKQIDAASQSVKRSFDQNN